MNAQTHTPPVCPNCGQWQHNTENGYPDCFHECAKLGFAPRRFPPYRECSVEPAVKDLGPLPLEHCQEYDAAAQWCAERGLTGAIGDPLPDCMGSPGAIDYIQADPEAFQERVRQTAYALAMSRATQ